CREGLSVVNDTVETVGLAALLQEMARACFFSGLLEEGLPYCERAIDIAARLQAAEVQAESLTTLGLMLAAQRRFDEALRAYDQAIVISEAARLPFVTARTLNNRAVLLENNLGELQ